MARAGPKSLARLLFAALAAALLAHHVTAIFTENINWDEFALLERAVRTLETGVLQGGGRPGLAVLLLLPIVDGCDDSITAVRSARLLWTGITFAYLAGFLVLLLQIRKKSAAPLAGAALGLALLVLVPVFLRWSLQVRTDQLALAFGVWGGVALLASRRHVAWAALAGLLFGLGYLSSQKLVYLAALCFLLAAGSQFCDRELHLRRDLLRTLAVLAAGLATILAFRAVVSLAFAAPPALNLQGHLEVFAFYRTVLGFRVYSYMLPTLAPHLVVGALTLAATVRALRTTRDRRSLVVAWLVLVLGAAVAWFHAGAFPYFYLTLGLFPAAAAAVAYDPITEALPTSRVKKLVVGGVWGALLVPALGAAIGLHNDTQEVQRESFAFINRHFEQGDRGFHPEGALFCRQDPDRFKVHFSQNIIRDFSGDGSDARMEAFIEEFRTRPVQFILESFRLEVYPRPIQTFWRLRYVPYASAVWVPGARIYGPTGHRARIEILVEGVYRLNVSAESSLHPQVQVGGHPLSHGETLHLEPGYYDLLILEDLPRGVLVLDLPEPPSPPQQFYSLPAREEFEGRDYSYVRSGRRDAEK